MIKHCNVTGRCRHVAKALLVGYIAQVHRDRLSRIDIRSYRGGIASLLRQRLKHRKYGLIPHIHGDITLLRRYVIHDGTIDVGAVYNLAFDNPSIASGQRGRGCLDFLCYGRGHLFGRVG